jgi:hypothetical protein
MKKPTLSSRVPEGVWIACIVVGVLIFAFIIIGIVEHVSGRAEISDYQYGTIENMCESEPELVNFVQPLLEDDKINAMEYEQIKKKHSKLYHGGVIERLKK